MAPFTRSASPQSATPRDALDVRPVAEAAWALERCQNELAALRLEAQGRPMATHKREKLKLLPIREKELVAELKRSQRAEMLIALGDDLRKRVNLNDAAGVANLCKTADARFIVDSANFEGTTSLMKAAMYNRVEVLTVLLEAGASVDRADHSGRTALCLACGNGALEVVERLCAWGATVTAQAGHEAGTQHGWTPIMYAAEGGHLSTCRLLVERSHVGPAELLAASAAGHTAIELARLSTCEGARSVVDYLQPLTDTARARTAEGVTAPKVAQGWRRLRKMSSAASAAEALGVNGIARLGMVRASEAEAAVGTHERSRSRSPDEPRSLFARMLRWFQADESGGSGFLRSLSLGESVRRSSRSSSRHSSRGSRHSSRASWRGSGRWEWAASFRKSESHTSRVELDSLNDSALEA